MSRKKRGRESAAGRRSKEEQKGRGGTHNALGKNIWTKKKETPLVARGTPDARHRKRWSR